MDKLVDVKSNKINHNFCDNDNPVEPLVFWGCFNLGCVVLFFRCLLLFEVCLVPGVLLFAFI